LRQKANEDASCALNVLDEVLQPYELAFAFRRNFPYDAVKANISASLTRYIDTGVAGVRPKWSAPRHSPYCFQCLALAIGGLPALLS
jgi:hypothetical protein